MQPHQTKPLEKKLAQNEIDAAILEMQKEPMRHPLNFCEAVEYCKYASTNCLYGQKKCWYE